MYKIDEDGEESRSLLTNVERPNNLFRRVRDLEQGANVVRGGVRGGGDPGFGFPQDIPRLADATPRMEWTGTDWTLAIDLTIAYSPPPDYELLEVEVVAEAGHPGYNYIWPQLPPFDPTFALERIGLQMGATYAVRARAYTRSRGRGQWGDFFSGIEFETDPYAPDPVSNMRRDTAGTNPPLGYGWRADGAYATVLWDYTGSPEPDHFEWEAWRAGEPANKREGTLPAGSRSLSLDQMYVPDTWTIRVRGATGPLRANWVSFSYAYPEEDVAEPSGVTLARSVWNWNRREAEIEVTFTAATPSGGQNPIDYYFMRVTTARTQEVYEVRGVLRWIFYLAALTTYTVEVQAVSTSGAYSSWVPVSPPVWTAPAQPPSGDGLRNASFEQADPLDPTKPLYWQLVSGTTGSNWSRSNTRAAEGSYALLLEVPAGGEIKVRSDRMTVSKLRSYFSRIRYNPFGNVSTDLTLSLYMKWFDKTGLEIQQDSLGGADHVGNSDAWTTFEYVWPTLPSSVVEGELQIWLNEDTGSTVGRVFIDDLAIDRQGATPDYGDNTITQAKLETLSPSPAGTYTWGTVSNKGLVTAAQNPEFAIHFFPAPGVGSGPYSATTIFATGAWAQGADLRLVRIAWVVRVLTTNNLSNYWTLRLGNRADNGAGQVLADVTTQGASAGQYHKVETGTFAANDLDFSTSSYNHLLLEVRKDNGAPGDIEVLGVTLYVRQVG